MEIKKADSKGRVTGFEPGRYYSLVRDDLSIILNPLHEGGYTDRNEVEGVLHEGETVTAYQPLGAGSYRVSGLSRSALTNRYLPREEDK